MLTLLVATALAADLQLTFSVPGRAPVKLTVRDVSDGPQPTITVPGAEAGVSYRFAPDLTRSDGAYTMRLTIDEVRNGRERVKTLATPTIHALAGEEVRFMTGTRVPIAGTDPVQFTAYEYAMTASLHEGSGS